ncbi:cation:proton antiporter [Planctomycetota bacterium]
MNVLISWFESFQDIFAKHIVFSTGLLLLAGYFIGKGAEKLKLPVITGYILAGLVLGRSVFNLIPDKVALHFNSMTEIALGLIAVIIGAEFNLGRLRRAGLKIITITIFQAIFAFVFVAVFFMFTNITTPYILILAAIATATAPAATVVIVKTLRARGEFIDYLYGVVAIDDAICVVVFSIIFAMAAPLIAATGTADAGVMSGLLNACREILFSCALGGLGGFLLNLSVRKKNNVNELLLISLGVIFLVTAAAIVLHLSLLIANMTLGGMLINLSPKNKKILHAIEPITPPLFALFFVLAGTELDLGIFAKGIVILYGIIYLASRFIGKYAGTYCGALVVKSSKQIRNYLGLCLFPQAGVAIGLVLFVQTSSVFANAPEQAKSMLVLCVNVVLLSVFINELIGPLVTKFGITKGADLE